MGEVDVGADEIGAGVVGFLVGEDEVGADELGANVMGFFVGADELGADVTGFLVGVADVGADVLGADVAGALVGFFDGASVGEEVYLYKHPYSWQQASSVSNKYPSGACLYSTG